MKSLKWLIITAIVAVSMTVPAGAATISWSPATVSDDNGGNFLSGAALATSSTTAILTFPSFFTTGTFGFPSNQLNLSIAASVSGGVFNGVNFTLFGSFSGGGLAQFVLNANATPPVAGSLSTGSFSGFIPVSPSAVLNLSSQLNLFDEGGSAAVSRVEFTPAVTDVVAAPESPTIILVLLGLGITLAAAWKYRVSASC